MAEGVKVVSEKTAINTTFGEANHSDLVDVYSTDVPNMPAKNNSLRMDIRNNRFPYSIVWTPIPCLTWFFPIIGHMGIATSTGVIRDFAGPYYVSEDDMAFGNPTKYWTLDPSKVSREAWDSAVAEASEVYKKRMHNLFCDNCHSHVAMALNLMQYDGSRSWNMVKLCLLIMVHGKYVSFCGFLKTWLPFLFVLAVILVLCLVTHLT
ncbi:transmembrane protein 222-like [Argonauta hians]